MPNTIRRPAALVAAALALGLHATRAVAAPAAIILTVDSTLDDVDSNPGNGICHAPSGGCTLRAAIIEADKTSGADVTIRLPAGTYSLTISADVTDTANIGDLNLTPPAVGNPTISLQGAGAARTIIDANHLDRVMHVESGRTAALSDLTLRGGLLLNHAGGGLYNEGTVTLSRVVVRDNDAGITTGQGGVARALGARCDIGALESLPPVAFLPVVRR